ncbi:MAG: PAS domain S-box protein [Verrucomicrobia bacterium]|nr:PAS domain S-box protein [Verrucomicrobiota bacterium]
MQAALALRREHAGAADGYVCIVQDLTANRQNEQALREREESYRLLFEQCPDALFVVSQVRIVLANIAAQRHVGAATPDALVGLALTEFGSEPSRAAFGEWLRDFEAQKDPSATAVTETMLRLADGGNVCVRVTGVRLALRDAPAVLLLAHDITGEELAHDVRAQALAAGARHDSEARRAALLAASPDAIISVSTAGVIDEWNEAAREILGHTAATAIGRPVGEMLGAPAVTAQRLADLARSADVDESRGVRLPDVIAVRHADGEEFFADLFVNESPAGAPRFYTLFLGESSVHPETHGASNQAVPAPGIGCASVAPGEQGKIRLSQPRGNDHPEPPARNGSSHTGPNPTRLGSSGRPWLLERAQQANQASAEARRSIGAIISHTRTPWGGVGLLSRSEVEELERVIRLLEIRLDERELALAAAETKLTDKSRDIAEAEALLKARQKLLTALQVQPAQGDGAAAGTFSTEEIEALRKLKLELERQADSLTAAREELRLREEFVERSEAALMEKMQAQQERAIELEQLEEDLKAGANCTCARKATVGQPANASVEA